MGRICIPDYEYKERIERAAALIRKKGLDVMVVSSTESDYANARYFSGFWPLFERAGVAISANGDAALLVGPESAIFAKDFGKIDKIFVLKEFFSLSIERDEAQNFKFADRTRKPITIHRYESSRQTDGSGRKVPYQGNSVRRRQLPSRICRLDHLEHQQGN